MTIFKGTLYYALRTVSVLLTIALVVICLFFGWIFICNLAHMDVPTLGPFKIYLMLTDSMAPRINIDDAVIVNSSVAPGKLGKGDIITFSAFESDTVITHRIVSVEDGDQSYSFRTKGDNNNSEDSFTTPASRVIGKYIFKIPRLAAVFNTTRERPYIIAIVVVAVIVLQILIGVAIKYMKPETAP